MRILVISDSHDNIVRLKHSVGFANTSKLAAIIHCGDWSSPSAVETMQDAEIPVYGVLGNADVDPQMVPSLRNNKIIFDIDFLKLNLSGRNVGVCHFPGKLEDAIRSQEYDVLFHGHTHKKKDKLFSKTRVVNPGALQKTPVPSLAVYDTGSNTVEFVDLEI